MDAVAFFKLQAKNFLKDWKTRYRDEEGLWQYRSRFIDVDRFFLEAGYGDWGGRRTLSHACPTFRGPDL